MKKTLVSALTTALVVGAASTTFAAANPFSDVPADHWAYDAVSELAADGIIEGYGDGTYRGQRQITRYEMAQMVAKAMAKSEQADAQTRALIDRLAAEFSDELNNLGVRVSALEEKVDNVIWKGQLRYTYANHNRDGQSRHGVGGSSDSQTHEILLRLEPTMTVNDHWKVKARLDATANWEDDTSNDVKLVRAYAEGKYGSTVIDAGLMPLYTTQGFFMDDEFSGLGVTFGKGKTVEGTLFGGRVDFDDLDQPWRTFGSRVGSADDSGDLYGAMVTWRPSSKFSLAGEYFHFQDKRIIENISGERDNQNVWGIASTYKFDNNWAIDAGYWANTSSDNNYDAVGRGINSGRYYDDANDHSYNFELRYKGVKAEDRGSFGLWAAYRHIGTYTALDSTYDGASIGEKGWEFGGRYAFDTNIVGSLIYFRGQELTNSDYDNKDVSKFFGRVQFFF